MITELLQELARFVGIEEIVFDSEGFCTLQLRDQFLFVIRHDEEQSRFVMAAQLTAPVEALSNDLLAAALSFNFNRMAFSGSWMALDRENGTLFLADEFLISIMDDESFRKRLEHFFQDYLACQGIFNGETIAALSEKEHHAPLMQTDQLA